MGVVYRAHDTLLEREVALKIIGASIEGNTDLRERFFREARAAGQLSHRNIITIHDLGEHEGQPYLSMEFLKGEDLQHRLTRPDPLPLARKLEIAYEICEGLAYAHRRGLIHRDIKPANIFITDEGVVKILDFGLARMVSSELTASNVMLGTLNYMAPEQVRGERIDHRADIFSFGVVLYEILSGRKAFQGDSFATTLYKILQDVPEPLLNIDATLPHEVVMLVEKAIAKGRDERYQDLSELSRDLALQRQHLAMADAPTSVTPAGRVPSDPPRPSTVRRPESGGSKPVSGESAGQIPPDAPTGITPLTTPRPRPRAPFIVAAAVAVAALAGLAIWLSRRGDASPQQAAVESPAPSSATPSAPTTTVRPPPASAVSPPPAAAAPADATPASSPAADARAADDARARMNRAKAAARQAGDRAVRSQAFAAGLSAERDGARMFQSKQMAEATARFYEAAGHFRSAELGASAPDTQVAPPVTESRAEPQATPQPATPAPPPSGSAAPAPIVPAPPTTSAPPPEPAPASPAPAIPPAVRTPPSSTVPVDNAKALDEGVRELIKRYQQALEAKSVDALKRLWPSLQGAQEEAIRQEFMHARRIDVEISNIDITGSGNTATARFLRRYQLSTVDNQRLLTNSRTTLSARRNGGDWVIERVQFEAIK